jgi:hypothetical protein
MKKAKMDGSIMGDTSVTTTNAVYKADTSAPMLSAVPTLATLAATLSTSTPICKKCQKMSITLGSLFCPYCGAPFICNTVIYNKTTRDYDPMNPVSKPWRQPPPNIAVPSVSSTFFNKKPWKPIMKHGQKVKLAKLNRSSSVEQRPDHCDKAAAQTDAGGSGDDGNCLDANANDGVEAASPTELDDESGKRTKFSWIAHI